MSVVVKLADARLLKNLIQAVQDEVDHAALVFHGDRLEVSVMDKARSVLVYFVLPKEVFMEYTFPAEDPVILPLSFKQLWEQVFRSAGEEPIVLQQEPASVTILLEGPPPREFTIPLVVDENAYPIDSRPELALTCKVILATKALQQMTQTLQRVGEAVEIQTNSHGLQLTTHGDGVTKAKITLSPGEKPLHEQEGFEHPARAEYTLKLLQSFPKHLIKQGERVSLEFGQDLPLTVKMGLAGGGELGYFVAPRIKEEEI